MLRLPVRWWLLPILIILLLPPLGIEARAFDRAEPFEAVDRTGKQVRVVPEKGTAWYIHFWASWCGGCMAQLPSVAAIHRQLDGHRIQFVSVSLDYRKEKLDEVIERVGIGFPVVFSGRGWEDTLVAQFDVDSIPDNVLLDGELNVIGRKIFGPPLEKALRALAAGKIDEARAICQRVQAGKAALDDIGRLLRRGKNAEAREAMERFLEEYPDSPESPAIRSYLASSQQSEKPLFAEPEAADLKPPEIRFPAEVFVPEFEPGSPGKMTSEHLRYVARALEAYREETGAYPPDLSVLCRNRAYMSEIPPDPFGGELRYRTDGDEYWILAGRGPDGVPDPRVDQYRGDPQALERIQYAEGEGITGDIVAFRSLKPMRRISE
jgi:thiol-disulfide isomerase/thioredoxin